MGVRDLAYQAYERRLLASLADADTPRHVGVILDGNRRWAKAFGSTPSSGHQAGAAKITELLGWCEESGVEVVTLWLLSTDNLGRPEDELAPLLAIIEDVVRDLVAARRWRLHPVGALDLLPLDTARVLKEASAATADVDGLLVNVAVGYGGRREIADAVRSLLAEHLYTRGQPDPDLVIRTSGEQRLSGFMLWQSAHSEFYFCEAYWPAFREIDFLRAIRTFQMRARRFGR